MMLFTFVVTSGTKSYTSQHLGADWNGARDALLSSPSFREFTQGVMPVLQGEPLCKTDVVLFVPMDPLTNCWVLQGGRAVDYVTAIVVATSELQVSSPAVEGT